jgi:hypothetical protein
LPSQVPSCWQVDAPSSEHWLSGSIPGGTAVQCPSVPVSPHDMQVPVQVVEQQNPCAQVLLSQSLLTLHADPSGDLPHLFEASHMPVVQSVLTMHDIGQDVPLPHSYGEHGCVAPGVQLPAPSQWPASVSVDPTQDGIWQVWLLE